MIRTPSQCIPRASGSGSLAPETTVSLRRLLFWPFPAMLLGDVPRDRIEHLGAGGRRGTDPGQPAPSPVFGPIAVFEMDDVESPLQFLQLHFRDFDVIGVYEREELPGEQFLFGISQDTFKGRIHPGEEP